MTLVNPKTSDDPMVKPDRLNGDSNSSIARKAPITKSPSMDNNLTISSQKLIETKNQIGLMGILILR